MEKINNDQLIGLMSLNEEINSLNQKIRQMVEQLHATSDGLAGLQDMTSTLTSKANQLKTQASSYKPHTMKQGTGAIASHNDGKRERIVPTPENYKDYLPENQKDIPVPAVVAEVPSFTELTKTNLSPVLDRDTGEPRKVERKQTKASTGTKKRVSRKDIVKSRKTEETSEPKKKGFFSGGR
jgi:uncharacterized phage infection (PIP) family protein YhgE